MNKNVITVESKIYAPVEKVWGCWVEPTHIVSWAFASPDWHAPKAENDLRVGGSFTTRMEARDGSFGFEFGGVYTEVQLHSRIAYVLGDGRKVTVDFSSVAHYTQITESFEPEDTNPAEMQKAGWQAILNSFKNYVENMLGYDRRPY